jgi:hypothetical protein
LHLESTQRLYLSKPALELFLDLEAM